MKRGKIQVNRISVLWTYIGTVVSMTSNFLILPFLFGYLNGKEIGFWYLLLSINGLIALFDFGFDPSFARNIAYVWSGAAALSVKSVQQVSEDGEINFHLLAKVIAAARYIYLALSIVATALIITLGSVYVDHVVFSKMASTSYLAAWIIFCFSMFINLYYGYMSALLRGTGKIIEVNKALVFSRLIQMIFSVGLLVVGAGFLAPVIGLFAYGLSYRQFCRWYFYKDPLISSHHAIMKSKVQLQDVISILKTIWPNSWRDGLVSLSNYAVTQGTSLIAGVYMPLGQVGVYSLGVQFANALAVGANAISSALHPAIQSSFARRDFESIRASVARATSLYSLVVVVGAIGVYNVVFPILHIFKHSAIPSLTLFALLIIYFYLFYLQSSFAAYIADMNEIPYVKAFLVTAILFLIISPGVLRWSNGSPELLVVTSIVCQVIYNNWKWPITLLQKIHTTPYGLIKVQWNEIQRLVKSKHKH